LHISHFLLAAEEIIDQIQKIH
jgi:hypothetical protein